ncbi:PKD domain-containing protein [Variovorax sp. J22R133]|uniref:PKD domain-containing protein n=1 Tax=Variovorax brevis TaxID=3053503 RepID=UPI002577DD8D|nr:PKD domain-containing protein [Variovorax sp. J22R133]MDM0113743.1 PKD domain-containing protein [Variovorax sp. J22R133]
MVLALLAGCGGGNSAPPSASQSSETPTSPAAPNSPSGPAAPTEPPNALFEVGAATVSIAPDTPVNVGGYSDKSKPAIQVSNDPLEVRAFVVAKGDKAVAFAVVDSTGWFGEYQDADAGLGQFGARVDAAQKLADRGFKVDRSAVMVSTTHSHATPTLVGIWGLMGTPNRDYLKKVHDAVVQAVDLAASNLKTSELWTANGNIDAMVWQNGGGTNHVDGFAVDARMPVLWARDPKTGATNALYVSIPTHPDQFRPFNGAITQGFSADVPGYVRKQMDDTIGGTSVVGSGTLGRQEPPGKNPDYAEVSYQGEYLLNALHLAMAQAAPLKTDTIGSSETLSTSITVGSSAGNQGLLSLMKYNAPSAGLGGPNCNAALGGTCSVPRALVAPWCNGNCAVSGSGSTSLGTYTTALRIGPLLYISNPGEAFPEVNETVRDEVLDAQSVNVVGLAGDFLGYYWSPSDYTSLQFTSSDFERYNVGPDLAQITADGAHANAAALGFKVKPAKDVVKAFYDSSMVDLPGIQFYSTRIATTPASISFYGSTSQPQSNYKKPAHVLSMIDWDFGDSSGAVTSNSSDRLAHNFTTPGSYKVTAKVTDINTGGSRSWSQTLTIHQPFSVAINAVISEMDASKAQLSLAPEGGQGRLLAARWTCPDGEKVEGLIVACKRPPRTGIVQVTAWDGAGNSATSQSPVP